jgi:hypothetical protein
VLAHLAERGLDRGTLVFVTSDHGEEFLEHGSWEHQKTLYEEVVRIPMMLAGPGVAPRRGAQQASLLDVAPTLLAWAGLPVPDSAQGRSLLQPLPQREAYGETDHTNDGTRKLFWRGGAGRGKTSSRWHRTARRARRSGTTSRRTRRDRDAPPRAEAADALRARALARWKEARGPRHRRPGGHADARAARAAAGARLRAALRVPSEEAVHQPARPRTRGSGGGTPRAAGTARRSRSSATTRPRLVGRDHEVVLHRAEPRAPRLVERVAAHRLAQPRPRKRRRPRRPRSPRARRGRLVRLEHVRASDRSVELRHEQVPVRGVPERAQLASVWSAVCGNTPPSAISSRVMATIASASAAVADRMSGAPSISARAAAAPAGEPGDRLGRPAVHALQHDHVGARLQERSRHHHVGGGGVCRA